MAEDVTPDEPAAEVAAGSRAPAVRADDPVDDADVVDELPDDLTAAGYVGPYLFPNNNRRRVPGVIYLVVAALAVAAWAFAGDSIYVNGGYLLAGVILAVVGAYHLLTGWDLDVDEQDALVAAGRRVGFPVGHASAQMGWRGLRSRPLWRILLYSDENPPAKRALVLVDGVDGTVVEHFVEDNPEDWSDLS
ncbi:MAG TPA: hypothetical protein VF743_03465 [Acidimicrobiales bacterium]